MSSFNKDLVLDVPDELNRSVVNMSTVRLLHHILYRVVPVNGKGSGAIRDHVVAGAKKKSGRI